MILKLHSRGHFCPWTPFCWRKTTLTSHSSWRVLSAYFEIVIEYIQITRVPQLWDQDMVGRSRLTSRVTIFHCRRGFFWVESACCGLGRYHERIPRQGAERSLETQLKILDHILYTQELDGNQNSLVEDEIEKGNVELSSEERLSRRSYI